MNRKTCMLLTLLIASDTSPTSPASRTYKASCLSMATGRATEGPGSVVIEVATRPMVAIRCILASALLLKATKEVLLTLSGSVWRNDSQSSVFSLASLSCAGTKRLKSLFVFGASTWNGRMSPSHMITKWRAESRSGPVFTACSMAKRISLQRSCVNPPAHSIIWPLSAERIQRCPMGGQKTLLSHVQIAYGVSEAEYRSITSHSPRRSLSIRSPFPIEPLTSPMKMVYARLNEGSADGGRGSFSITGGGSGSSGLIGGCGTAGILATWPGLDNGEISTSVTKSGHRTASILPLSSRSRRKVTFVSLP
mmetsp:Transcript_49347/g.110988  ORF Transcript_49347/g.110988 Transcript_49347/m.110988 type:complete len:308 (-) Transcript_49347:318-1241(-)